mmetsp:Transcript_12987/g.25925  ORF Transcript_12987/g.25925 Transcript_12987/m.25925 type:complete len:174 (-) Transcript_12987:202-723(-)|eukprot:CAMPEP_0181310500 /NCGR_PEP_ID=MMETSP1101-20121128/12618_1 /TAXON_ID=46948 /ORGANISM="Rhodomonas abbreviata, Strain Caron Lab Isolate" /LENGTH=173 /DNA_ID=CAMNT_0023417131 /DNA_START=30 /DNA_END=551 /DNA_ORIENTATION=+
MYTKIVLALLLAFPAASVEAFTAPTTMALRSPATRMAMTPQDGLKSAALGVAVSISLMGSHAMPAEASVNSQMGMNTNSFSVLQDNSYEYKKSTGRAINPYASEEEKMAELARMSRMEECQATGKSNTDCEFAEKYFQESQVKKQKGSSILSIIAPVAVTTGISGVLIKFLNK